MKPLSIIIPALNERHYLPRLLESIARTTPGPELEVIVVDGGSDDGTPALARAFSGRVPGLVVVSSERGIAHQRNLGAAQARHEHLLFLDADTELSGQALERIIARFGTRENFIAIPRLYPYDGQVVDHALVALAYICMLGYWRTHPIVPGMCILTTRAVHRRIGGFNEQAVYAEDIDYGFRAVKACAKYTIAFGVKVGASARRVDQHGHIQLGLMWSRWIAETIKSGPITDASKYRYRFGNFTARRLRH
jgi:glycosyltransferase involved in cell wall biosynthesis